MSGFKVRLGDGGEDIDMEELAHLLIAGQSFQCETCGKRFVFQNEAEDHHCDPKDVA